MRRPYAQIQRYSKPEGRAHEYLEYLPIPRSASRFYGTTISPNTQGCTLPCRQTCRPRAGYFLWLRPGQIRRRLYNQVFIGDESEALSK